MSYTQTKLFFRNHRSLPLANGKWVLPGSLFIFDTKQAVAHFGFLRIECLAKGSYYELTSFTEIKELFEQVAPSRTEETLYA